jgi:hypothetical protein
MTEDLLYFNYERACWSREKTKVYKEISSVESRRFYYVGLLLTGAPVLRRWERELKEGQGREHVGAGRRNKGRK